MSSAPTAHSFWITRPERGEIREQRLPRLREGEAQVRSIYSAVSRGTELLVYTGRVPQSEYARMRAPFQEGEFPGPVKYGYMSVGVVEAGPGDWPGRQVFCLYPHQTRYNVPLDALHPLPHGVPAHRAVLAANLETALNALWDASPGKGSRVSVIGAGALGCLCAWLAQQHFDADVELIDIDTTRAHVAARLGVAFSNPSGARSDSPVILHTSASEDGLRAALSLAAFEALILELSWYGDTEPRLPLGREFHSRRLTLKASQVGHVAPSMRGHATRRSRLRMALRMLSDPALDILIDSQSRFDELPKVMAELASGTRTAICHRIHYEDKGESHV
jgi:NADPH:quinone reductase-like Zn-dependent oxidoreductase